MTLKEIKIIVILRITLHRLQFLNNQDTRSITDSVNLTFPIKNAVTKNLHEI